MANFKGNIPRRPSGDVALKVGEKTQAARFFKGSNQNAEKNRAKRHEIFRVLEGPFKNKKLATNF